MPKQVPRDFRDRAVRLVVESRQNFDTEWAAIQSVAPRMGLSAEALRRWTRQAEIDAGTRPGLTESEHAEIRRLRKENQELRRAIEILRTALAFFAAELDRPTTR